MIKRCCLYVLCLLLLGSCTQQRVPAGWLRVGLAHMPISLDPRYATDAASQKIQALMHRGLVKQGEDFLPRPDVAASWQQVSPREWLFTLRDDVFFHDGQRLEAADVVATLNSILDPARGSPLRAGFAVVEHIEAIDARHLRLQLSSPDSSLLTRLSVGILPRRLAAMPQHTGIITGCGPFIAKSWQGQRLLLQRRQATGQGPTYVEFIRVKDAVTRALKLARGEIDFMQNDFPLHMLDFLRRQPGVKIATTPSTTFSYIGINMQDPLLRDLRVRKALMLSLDRAALKRALLRDAPVLAETVLTPRHWASARLVAFDYDPQQAEALLDAAGLPRQADGWRAHLTYRTSTNPERLQLATAIADQWRRIGLDVNVESLEWGAFYARIKRGDFQLFSLSWVGISDADIYRWILHSSMWPPKGANRGRYRNTDVDRWLDEARAAASITKRQQLYRKVERKMHDDLVYLPLWYEPVVAVSGPRLHGFTPRADAALTPLRFVQLR